MSDIKFDIMQKSAIQAELAKKDSDLEAAMQIFVERHERGEITSEQLSEIRKNISNRLKNEKELRKQEEEERKKLATPKKEEEKSTKKVVLGEGDNANDMLINADAEMRGGEVRFGDNVMSRRFEYDDTNLDYNKLYTNNNPLYNSFRHDVTVKGIGKGAKSSNFWEMEETDALNYLREKYGHTDIKFKETNTTTQRRTKHGKKGESVSRTSFDAIKMIAPDGSEEVIELDLQGFWQEDFGGWDAVKIDNYNKLTNFLEAHTAESDKAQTITNDEERAIYLEKIRKEKLEPTEKEYTAQIEEKGLTSIDIFNEKKQTRHMGATSIEVNLEFGGYEKEIKEARKQLIQENRNKAAASNTPYVEPTVDEIKEKALLNLQNAERKYLRKFKYDAYMNELEDFEDWDADWILKRAKEEGVNLADDYERIDFQEKIRKEMKDQYYKLKVAGNDEEADAVLKYRANELLLKNSVSNIEASDVYKRFNETNANIQNPKHNYPSSDNDIQLDNGKVIPLHVWEQHTRDHVEVLEMMSSFDSIMKDANEAMSVLENNSFKWDLIKRNYNDWERTQEVLGYGFGNIAMTGVYGVPKFLTFGASGGDDEAIRWKETVAKNRQSFRKDVEWDRAFEDGNFGRFMAQSAVDQIPIYATLMTGHAGLGILGASVFGDKWAEMTMEDRYKFGPPSPTWEKWFKSLGYAGSEVVLDYMITVPIMRNARNMMRGGSGKALLDNSMNAFFKNNAKKALIFSPVLESFSESATQVTQNMIDGKPVLNNIDHAAFLGLTMGMAISYTGFTAGLITSQFSDHKSLQEVRDNMTEMQKLYDINADIKEGLKYLGPRSADRAKGKETIKNNEARIEELMNKNEAVINKVGNNIKDKLDPVAYKLFLENELRAEQIKVEAQKILDSGLDKKTQDKRLKELLAYFNASNSAAQQFKDPKSFGSKWVFVVNPTNEEGKENLERLKDLATTELQNEGNQKPEDKKVLERARYIWAKEQVRESNGNYKKTALAKNYTPYETKEEASTFIENTINKEVEVIKNSKISEKDKTRIIKDLEADKKRILAGIKDGSIYGLNRVAYNNLAGTKGKTADAISFSIVESQARAERFETRVHEGGHQVFWNALQAAGGNKIFTPMAEQILDWTKKNDKGMHKRIMLRTGNGRQGAAEIISVFLEEVGDGKFDVKKNKGFANLWALMSNDALTTTTGKDFNFNFAGEIDVMEFLVTLGKKIKNNTLTRSDEAAIRKAFKAKADKKAEAQFSQVYQEVETFKEALSSKNPKTKRDAALMVAYTLENEVDRRLPVLEGINQEDKADIVNNFLFDEKRGLMGLLNGYNPKKNDSIMGYLNSTVPRTRLKLLDARLIEFYKDDPRFGNVIQSMQQEGVTEKVEKQGGEITVTTPKRERVVAQDKVVLETFGETALQNEIRTDIVAFGVEGVNTYLDVKKNTVSHRKFIGVKNAKGEVIRKIEITPELKAQYKKDGKKPPKELKSLRIPTGKYYPILEKVAKMYGVDPLRLIREQDLTTTMRKSSQDYILSKRDEHIVSLPEGTTRAGNPTGIANTALGKAFFKAGGRMSFKTTGTGKGLKEQAKQRIDPSDYLAIFGLIPRNRINNTSVDPALRSQIIQTAVLAINQGVRQEKDVLNLTKERVDQIKDGKAVTMYSEDAVVAFKQTYIQPIGVLGASLGLFRVPNKKVEDGFKKDGTPKTYSTRDLDAPFIYKDKDGKIVETGQNYREAGVSVINNFLESHPQFRQLIRITTTGGKKGGFFQTVGNFNNLINNANVEQAYISRTKYGGDGAVYSKAFHEKLIKGEFNQENKDRLPLLRDFYKAIESHLQTNPRDVWMFEEMLLDTGKQQNVFTRILAPFVFYPVDSNKKPIFNQPIKEEHTDPQNLIGKALLSAALQGKVDEVWKVVGKSYMQGGILDSKQYAHDKMIDDSGYSTSMPDVYYEKIVPRLLDGSLNLPDGYSSIVRLAASGIDLNMYYLHNEGKTIAEYFGVEGMEVSRANDLIIKQLSGEVSAAFSREVNRVDIKEQISENKRVDNAIAVARTTSYSQESRGITILDFDDTLATSKSLVISTSPEGTVRKLTAEEFAQEGADLLDQGWVHDFSEFSKVVDGKTASLFNKAMKLQGKFGPENMFVLTARPADSAPAIFEFLQANGLNIPLKNITGLANSTSEAKALWIADKVAEGYNDFYFADDALQNVQAVQNMLDQFDVKSKVQQARVQFSQDINTKFNDILESVTKIESKKRFSEVKARKRGASKGKFRYFIPPSHEDFVGILYNFMGKGKEGNAHRDFFEQALIRPLNRAYRELDTAKQSIANDYKNLNKEYKDVRKKLNKKTPDGDFTFQDAIRVYLWNKHGYKIPGLSPTDQSRLTEIVQSDPSLQAYAENLNIISKQDAYVNPTETWETSDIRVDLDDATGRVGRAQYFAEFNENAGIVFSKENLNKIEAAYGASFRSAIEDILYRTETGRNRPSGQNALVNRFMNYVNGSVGAVMFFNMRSALLQQMSMVNYINFADNNIFAAAKAFANQKQYWKDWAFIFNSDMIKQRRGGIKTDINGAELAASMRNAKNTPRALVAKLLELGFLPTQIGDNIAIASGGATFYRNRINTYLKQGLTQEEAQSKAFTDFQILTESSQQSARPDMVSQQQASPIGKIILAFQNVTSQFNRIGKKAFLDIKNRRITPGNVTQLQSDISNASRIAYYFAIQNAIFYTLQTALFAMMFDDDEDDKRLLSKKERVVSGSIDSVLRGTGVMGAVIATLKNMGIKFAEQRGKGWNKDESAVLMEMLNVSPPVGIKARKITNAEKTLNYNEKVIKKMETFDIDNPVWSAVTNVIEATTNIPINRLYNKVQNVRQALDNENTAFQRTLMFLGWSQYNLGIKNKEVEKVKKEVKGKKQKKKEDKRKTNQIEVNKKKQQQERKEGKTVKCAAVSKSGGRCRNKVESGGSFCTIHAEVKQRKDGKKTQCRKIKSNKKRCKMQTSASSGYCYYHD